MRLVRSSIFLLTFTADFLSAQPPGGRGGRRGGSPEVSNPQRGEMAVRRRIENLVRGQVQPTETQWRQLQALDQRMEKQRAQLNREEMAARVELRRLMQDSANVNQEKIGEAHDRLLKFPRRRVDLMESEQRELAAFLTPLQRAKYFAIQEQVRRQIERGRGGRPLEPGDSSPTGIRRP